MMKCETIWYIQVSGHYYSTNEWLNKCSGEERVMWAEKILQVLLEKEKPAWKERLKIDTGRKTKREYVPLLFPHRTARKSGDSTFARLEVSVKAKILLKDKWKKMKKEALLKAEFKNLIAKTKSSETVLLS